MKTFKVLVTFSDGAKGSYSKDAETFAGACLLIERTIPTAAFITSFSLRPEIEIEPVGKRFTTRVPGRNERIIKKAERLY